MLSDYSIEDGKPIFDEIRVQQLIQQWQIDSQGQEQLLEACAPIIRYVIKHKHIHIPGYELQDLVHETLIQLLAKLRLYRADRGRAFAFIFVSCYHFLIGLAQRLATHRSHITEGCEVSANKVIDPRSDPINDLMAAEITQALSKAETEISDHPYQQEIRQVMQQVSSLVLDGRDLTDKALHRRFYVPLRKQGIPPPIASGIVRTSLSLLRVAMHPQLLSNEATDAALCAVAWHLHPEIWSLLVIFPVSERARLLRCLNGLHPAIPDLSAWALNGDGNSNGNGNGNGNSLLNTRLHFPKIVSHFKARQRRMKLPVPPIPKARYATRARFPELPLQWAGKISRAYRRLGVQPSDEQVNAAGQLFQMAGFSPLRFTSYRLSISYAHFFDV